MTARAAGSGGPRPRKPAPLDGEGKPAITARRPPSRRDKLTRARAAGRRGEAAPLWIDDAELLAAYEDGANELGDSWAGDVDQAAPASSSSSSEPMTEPASPSSPALPMRGSLFPSTRAIAPERVRTTGPAGDVAGAFLGIIAAAFVVNVLRGTWTQWLRAKFLNQVGGAPRADPNAAPGLNSAITGPTPLGGTPGGSTPTGSQGNALAGVAAPGATIDPLTGSLASPLPPDPLGLIGGGLQAGKG